MKNWKDVFVYSLSGIVVLMFGAIVICLIFHLAPETNNNLLYLLAGALSTMTGTVISYHYGSSAGSAAKNDMLFKSQPLPPVKEIIDDVKKVL